MHRHFFPEKISHNRDFSLLFEVILDSYWLTIVTYQDRVYFGNVLR